MTKHEDLLIIYFLLIIMLSGIVTGLLWYYLKFRNEIHNKTKKLEFLCVLDFILPESIQKDFKVDIEDIVIELKERNLKKFHVTLIVLSHLINVIAHSFLLKIKDLLHTFTKANQ